MHEVIYVVGPKPALIERLAAVPERFVEYLSEPFVVTLAEVDRSAWRFEDYAVLLKYVFLTQVLTDNDGIEELGEFLAPVSQVADFDHWWSIKRHVVDGQLDELSREAVNYPAGQLALPENSLVRAELDRLRSKTPDR